LIHLKERFGFTTAEKKKNAFLSLGVRIFLSVFEAGKMVEGRESSAAPFG
jgi:hypothetical protein